MCLRSCKRKSAILILRHARRNASDTFSGVMFEENTRSVGAPPLTESITSQAKAFNQTVRESPFFVCGSRISSASPVDVQPAQA